jgi:hypothetical protein
VAGGVPFAEESIGQSNSAVNVTEQHTTLATTNFCKNRMSLPYDLLINFGLILIGGSGAYWLSKNVVCSRRPEIKRRVRIVEIKSKM